MNTGHVFRIKAGHAFDADDVQKDGQQTADDGWEWCVTPMKERSVDDPGRVADMPIHYGKAVWTSTYEDEVQRIKENGTPGVRTEERTEVQSAEWLLIPRHNIAVLSNPDAQWYVSRMLTGPELDPVEINCREFLSAEEVDQVRGAGFGRSVPQGIRKGVAYGDRVREDPDLGEDIERGHVDQLHFRHQHGREILKAYIAESGYVAAFGDDWGSIDFAPWVVGHVAPYVRDDESGETEDSQQTLDEADQEEATDA